MTRLRFALWLVSATSYRDVPFSVLSLGCYLGMGHKPWSRGKLSLPEFPDTESTWSVSSYGQFKIRF